jgi:hypothetical protein
LIIRHPSRDECRLRVFPTVLREANDDHDQGGHLKGVRYFMRNFTAVAVKEHLRSQIEDSGGSPHLTEKEEELVRFIRQGSFDWDGLLAPPPTKPDTS